MNLNNKLLRMVFFVGFLSFTLSAKAEHSPNIVYDAISQAIEKESTEPLRLLRNMETLGFNLLDNSERKQAAQFIVTTMRDLLTIKCPSAEDMKKVDKIERLAYKIVDYQQMQKSSNELKEVYLSLHRRVGTDIHTMKAKQDLCDLENTINNMKK